MVLDLVVQGSIDVGGCLFSVPHSCSLETHHHQRLTFLLSRLAINRASLPSPTHHLRLLYALPSTVHPPSLHLELFRVLSSLTTSRCQWRTLMPLMSCSPTRFISPPPSTYPWYAFSQFSNPFLWKSRVLLSRDLVFTLLLLLGLKRLLLFHYLIRNSSSGGASKLAIKSCSWDRGDGGTRGMCRSFSLQGEFGVHEVFGPTIPLVLFFFFSHFLNWVGNGLDWNFWSWLVNESSVG